MPQSTAKKEAKKKIPQGLKIFCDIRKCLACRACELACAAEHSIGKSLYSAVKETPVPKKRRHVSDSFGKTLSVGCQHCKEAACVTACMSGALSKDASGATMHDKEKCVGCWMCIMVCPFGAIERRIKEKVAVKCDLCPDREDFACVAACPTGALFAGTIDEFEKKIKKAK
ncbi:MAG: 4Fe-4S dicluster domain-containing protein [Candidatus Omnitrophica bacterium]|nr:4Fe-4S dicluster domain-containing protein [Candidatus Omnitrophota bacterium]